MNTLSLLIHGESKVGKTWLGDTAPAPRLILDAEGGNQWTPSPKVVWDPLQGPPPVPDGTWASCVVTVRDWDTVQRVYQWLATGQHHFVSLVIDSISEIQKRCKDNLAPLMTLDQRQWGELLTHMETLVRSFRDLTFHPTKPLQCVVLIAFTREQNGKFRPYVQGQLQTTMPYFLDVIGYLFPQVLEDGTVVRRLLIGSYDMRFEAGERVGGRLGQVIDEPNVEVMLQQLNSQGG